MIVTRQIAASTDPAALQSTLAGAEIGLGAAIVSCSCRVLPVPGQTLGVFSPVMMATATATMTFDGPVDETVLDAILGSL